ncbi:MAG: hypothetical protein MJ209_04375 [archaeon]|nr:hypothetical protein [archaeon]
MNFEEELQVVLSNIKNAQDEAELNYIRKVNEKQYWWTSIFICGLFYGLNGKIGKMILFWVISALGIILLFIPTIICYIYSVYMSYKNQKEFNDAMEYAILQRIRELQGKGQSNPTPTQMCQLTMLL